jgi:hypothetical protein
LRLDNREIIGARLFPINDLPNVPVTGPVRAYSVGQLSAFAGCPALGG